MTLFLDLIFGAVGTVYLFLGKKDHDPLFLIVGFLLIIYPYIFSNAFIVAAVGVALSLVPYAHRKGMF